MLTEANGLLYMRARYYSPDLMRFINEDIVTGDISNCNTLNRYSYVEGNPVTMVDPFGLCPQAKDAFDSIFDMEKIHGILDAVGFIPGLGDVCDAINALLYLSEGDMGNAALSALALLPLGDLLKGGKYTAKIVGKLDDIGGAVFKYLGKNCDNLLTTASKKVDDVLSFASKKCDNFFNFFRKHSDEMAEAVVRHGDDAVDSVLKGSSDTVIGNKLEYVFGNATGSRHNIERSLDMENKLNEIGIFDNATGRAFMENELEKAFNNTTNGIIQENGRIMKESLLTGPNGVAKMQSVWDGNKLITVEIFKSNWKSFIE